MKQLITILGPTASGKTAFATLLAHRLGGEIVSADSRQLYRGMDIGTGKDLAEYTVEGKNIPYHLIDICPPGYKYNLFEYHRDCRAALAEIQARGNQPILCGGTGLYIESILKGYQLPEVPENRELRDSLEGKSLEELTEILASYRTLHNQNDTDTCKRAIRAIEIAEYARQNNLNTSPERLQQGVDSFVVGIDIERELRRKKITNRLHARLEEGLIAEVEGLLGQGVSAEELIYYGLEYKFVTEYVIGKSSYNEMVTHLEIAIHQFAKRQMTWFRGMERRGTSIFWLDAALPMEEKLLRVEEAWEREKNGGGEIL